MILTKGLVYAANNFSDKLGVIEGDHRYTYKELEVRTAKIKASLQRMGVGKGDRVALFLMNDFRYVELMYAITSLGAIVVPLNVRFNINENIYVLNDSGAKVLYINREFVSALPKLKEAVPSIEHYILAEDPGSDLLEDNPDLLSYEEILDKENVSNLDYEGVHEDDPAGIFYTGGTTGKSKGVVLTHKNLQINAFHVIINLEYKKEDIYLHAGPMFHLADQASTFAVTLLGGTHAVLRMFTPNGVMEVIEKEKITMVMLVPTMINMVLHSPGFDTYDLSSLRRILYGASPMSGELLRKTMTLLPQTSLSQAYGMTEASPILTLLKPDDHVLNGTEEQEKRLSSGGQAVQSIDLKIVDPEDNEVPVNEIGEIIAKGPIIMKEYWNLREETAHAVRDGWFYTGDLGYIDEGGYVFVVDRAKDMIISGGENVYSVEVEDALSTHPAVLECAVFGIPDEKWGEVVTAAIVLKDNMEATEEELIEHVRQQISDYKAPRVIDILEELPKSGAGKILKRVIRDQYEKVPK